VKPERGGPLQLRPTTCAHIVGSTLDGKRVVTCGADLPCGFHRPARIDQQQVVTARQKIAAALKWLDHAGAGDCDTAEAHSAIRVLLEAARLHLTPNEETNEHGG
jgi:hypothetical protein